MNVAIIIGFDTSITAFFGLPKRVSTFFIAYHRNNRSDKKRTKGFCIYNGDDI